MKTTLIINFLIILVMKTFTLTYSDPSGQIQSRVLEIYADSFIDACEKALYYEQFFANRVLTDIHFDF